MNNIVIAVLPVLLFGGICAMLTRPRFAAFAARIAWIWVISIVAAVHLGVGLSIVNLDYVIGIQNGEIIMRGFTVPVAKQSYRKFREYYLDYCFKK